MKRSSTDLEIALAESVHRARNDLQAVMAMLRLQATAARDPAVRSALLDASARVRSLSSLNDQLDRSATGAGRAVDSVIFLDGLAADIRAMHFGDRPITLDVEADPHGIAAHHARPLGLILNELILNALKYAFPDRRAGTVTVTFRCRDAEYLLTVTDDGVGIDLAAPPQGTGLGRRIVRALTAQVGGTFEIGPGKQGGTECIVRWPTA